MADSTYEEAKRCPRCGKPGEDRQTTRVKNPREKGVEPGTSVHMIYCTTPVCRWYDTSWAVQVNPDGSVPPPNMHHDKQFPTRVPPGMTLDQAAEKARKGINRGVDLS